MALFGMGLLRMAERIPNTWKFNFEISDAVKPVWVHDIGTKTEIVVAKERNRCRPNHNIAKATFGFSAGEKASLQSLPKVQRRRAEQRLMRNAEAVEKEWCTAKPFDPRKPAEMVCQRCARTLSLRATHEGGVD